MTHSHDVITELRQPTRELRDAIPEAWAGVSALREKPLAPDRGPASVYAPCALAAFDEFAPPVAS